MRKPGADFNQPRQFESERHHDLATDSLTLKGYREIREDLSVFIETNPFKTLIANVKNPALRERLQSAAIDEGSAKLAMLAEIPNEIHRLTRVALGAAVDLLASPVSPDDKDFKSCIKASKWKDACRIEKTWEETIKSLRTALDLPGQDNQELLRKIGKISSLLEKFDKELSPYGDYFERKLFGNKYARAVTVRGLANGKVRSLCETLGEMLRYESTSPGALDDTTDPVEARRHYSAFDRRVERTVADLRAAEAAAPRGRSFESRLQLLLQNIEEVEAMSALLGVVRESSLNSSDGLYKSKTYYQSPEVFKGLRKAAGLDPQICEAVVVGGGPGGIATAHHLAQRGVDVVLFEAGSLGQAFSDAGAGHTHELRTNQYQSSLARDKVVSRSVLSDAGMQYVVPELGLDGFAEKARQARADFLDMSLGTERMSPKERMDPLYPVNRNLFWSYLATLADKAVEAGSATIIEHSPLSPRYPLWDAKRNLWCVQTAQGHEIYAQKLVLATGLQGSSVENSRLPDIFQKFAAQNEENTLTLLNRKQLREKADEIAALMSNQSTPSEAPQKKVILHDSNLGQPEIQSYIRGLKEGTRAVLVGSGESAIKAALDFLDQNPGCNLDFYCKGKLYPYQVQFPIVTRGDEPFERAVFDEEFAKITLAQVGKVFGSPVTPRSLADLLNAVKDGRVRLFEMGEKFDDSSVELMPGEGGKAVIRLNPKNDKIWTQLKEQEVEFKAHGILDSAQTMLPRTKWQPLTECDGPIIIATGYDQERASQRNQFAPYLFDAKQIVALNRDDFLPAQYEMAGEGSVASKSNSHLFTLGTVNPQSAYDTNLTGIGTRAHFIAAEIAASLGKGLPEEKFEPGVPREPEGRLIYEQMQADSQRRRAVFQHADDLYIAQLADKESKGTLEPVERVVLDRFRTLHDKVDTALIDWTIDRGSYTKPLFENLANVSDRIVRSKN